MSSRDPKGHPQGSFQSVSRRFGYALSGSVILALILFAAALILSDISRAENDLQHRLEHTWRVVLAGLRTPLWRLEHDTLSALLDSLSSDEDLVYIALRDRVEELAKSTDVRFAGKDFAFFRASPRFVVKTGDIVRGNRTLGTVELAMSRDRMRSELIFNVWVVALLTVLVIGAILLVSQAITRRYITRPLEKLERSAELIASGELDAPIEIRDGDEIGSLERSLKRMRDSIKTLVDALRESETKQQQYLLALEEKVAERSAELVHTLEKIREAHVVAETANRVKSQVMANVSHELQNPLHTIIRSSENLLHETKAPGYGNCEPDLKKIRSAGKHLLALINDILDLSRMETAGLEMQVENFEVSRLIQDLSSTVRRRIEKTANRLIVHCEENLGTMCGDSKRIRQGLLNLVRHACDSTHGGIVRLTVAREVVNSGSWFRFEVSDTGRGLTREQMERAFQPFAQDSSTQRRSESTGLGLAITRRMCQMMGGEVTVKSTANAGSTFTMRLPSRTVNRMTAAVVE